MSLENDLEKLSIDTALKSENTDALDEKEEQKNARRSLEEQQPGSSFANVPDDSDLQCDKNKYLVKTIGWKNKKVCIITQNENGPCPLVAICNVLFLRGDLEILPPDRPFVTFEYLVDRLGDYLLNHTPTDEPLTQSPATIATVGASEPNHTAEKLSQAPKRQQTSEFVLTYRHNLDAAFSILPNLKSGLDVNVKFDSIHGFEPTAELAMFDLFNVNLVHGWVTDPQDVETFDVIVNKCGTYNRAVELIVQADELSSRNSSEQHMVMKSLTIAEEEKLHEGFVATEFLKDTATQLTYFGLALLLDSIPPDTLCVLFRNNHFSTVYRHPTLGLYMLVTDSGLVSERSVVWESLADVDQGSSEFFNSLFSKPDIQENSSGNTDLDYAIAVSIQDEQKRQHRQSMIEQQQLTQQQPMHKPSPSASNKHHAKRNSNCIIT